MSIKKLKKNRLRIMTWNIYFGADLTPLIGTTPEEIPEAVTEVFNQFQQTDFPARAKSIAKIIYKTKPDIIGLHEVALWTDQSAISINATNFLIIFLMDLRKLGLDYSVIAVNRNFRNRLPSSTGDIISILDRDVILARCKAPLNFFNIQESNFQTNLVVPVGGQPFTVLRGWSSVDICLGNRRFRLVNTHLEGEPTQVRVAQANELLNGPGATDLPLIFIGDFNSNADGFDSPVYDMLIDAGFIDAWDIEGEGPGFTAFQARDLLNPISTLIERIDLILLREGFDVVTIGTVGDKERDRIPSGLWPSDHAGVVAIIKFEEDFLWLSANRWVDSKFSYLLGQNRKNYT